DTGTSEQATRTLIPHLLSVSIDHIDIVFISHAHFDHYEGLARLLSSNISIGSVYFNMPTKERCNEEPWGCQFDSLRLITNKLAEKGIPLRKVTSKMKFDLGPNTKLNVLYAFTPSNSPEQNISINDESLVMLLVHKGYRFLFTGDLDQKIGNYLAEHGENLRADVLKVPHHGATGLPPAIFFDAVNPDFCLVPAPAWLWYSERSAQTYNWSKDHNIPTYVSGLDGNVYIEIGSDGDLIVQSKNYSRKIFR
ncbi:MAG: MBL fold metallo-hydrolase, partial [Cyclobacteriaceae bacterium]